MKEGVEGAESGGEYKKRVAEERRVKLREKRVHGRILSDMEEGVQERHGSGCREGTSQSP